MNGQRFVPHRVRRADVPDARAIASVHVQSWQGAYRGLLPQDYLDNLSSERRLLGWQETLRETDWPRAGTLVAEHDQHIIGFADFRPTRDNDQDSVVVGELTSIYVVPAAWGYGTGRQLMTATLTALHDAGFAQATLWVLTSNARAIRFYLSNDWRPDGTTKQQQIAGQLITEARYRRTPP